MIRCAAAGGGNGGIPPPGDSGTRAGRRPLRARSHTPTYIGVLVMPVICVGLLSIVFDTARRRLISDCCVQLGASYGKRGGQYRVCAAVGARTSGLSRPRGEMMLMAAFLTLLARQ